MNEMNPQHEDEQHDPAALDAIDRPWLDLLSEPEPDLADSEDAFVQSVMQRVVATSTTDAQPTVLARIGKAALPYAVAAALLLAAILGYTFLLPAATPSGTNTIVQQPEDPSQPISQATVATHDDDQPSGRPKIALGRLIARAQTTATSSATTLTNTANEMPRAFDLDNVLNVLSEPVPDLKEILAPLQPKQPGASTRPIDSTSVTL